MRCCACNAMMPVIITPRGNIEELCSRCRSFVWRDLMSLPDDRSSTVEEEATPDNTIDFEPDPWDNPIDRNHEDSTEEGE